MKINRRQFIKLSGMTSFGLWTGLPSFIKFFEFIPSVEQDFIPVAGIFPNQDSIKENGIHLRWVLPPSKGIPDSLIIYRRKGSQKENNLFVRPADSNKKTIPEKIDHITFRGPLDTFSLAETNFGKCYEVKPINPNGSLRITFSSGVDFCNIQIGVANPLVAKAYHQDGTLSQSVEIETTETYKAISFRSTNGRSIKYVEIPINFTYLYFIEFNGNQFLCDSPGWEKIGFIDNENDIVNQLLFKRINPDAKNFYLSGSNDLSRYENTAGKYAGLMNAIRNPSAETFITDGGIDINEIPPDELILKPVNDSSAKINTWNLLMLGSLDPNNARILGLYFVDSSVKNENEIFDYKVEANYKTQLKANTICGVIQNVGGKFSDLPALVSPLTLIQTDKTWWEFDKDFNETHLGKVRLTWPIPNQNLNNETWKRFIQPVVYSLEVNDNKPRLITAQLDENSLYFFDQRVAFQKEEFRYSLVGVDIFGQVSKPLKEKIKLKDKDVPPPPVKLQFNYSDDQVFLQYEYSGFQYLSDPQINRFTIFQKSDSIYSNNKKVKYTSFEELGNTENGFRIIKINLVENIGTVKFLNIHFLENFDGRKLPAAKRKKFKISAAGNNSVTFISSSFYSPEPKGTVLLESDMRDKNGWLEAGTINFRKPDLTSRLINYVHFVRDSNDVSHFAGDNLNDIFSLHAVVKSSSLKRRSENRNLFEPNPIENELDEYTELLIDRTIIESDILTGGEISLGNINHNIISQSAGTADASNLLLQTKIVIDNHVNINPGTPVLISLPKINSDNTEKYIHNFFIFRIQANEVFKLKFGGEFLIRAFKNYKLNGKNFFEIIPVVLQLLSDLYPVNRNQLEAIVKCSKKISILPVNQNQSGEISNKILYFEPFTKNITTNLDAVSLNQNEAFKAIHFAIETTDNEGNNSPLSLFGQFFKTRTTDEKPSVPERPYPCDNKTAVKAFLKIPNSDGRSAFCLQWNDVEDASGNPLQYRYEVGRALDKTIIAVHKDLWLKGLVDSVLLPNDRIIETNNNSPIRNSSVLIESGLIEASANYGLQPEVNPEIFKGGRLTQGTGVNRKFYEIVKCLRENTDLKLMLREMVKTSLANNFTDHSMLPSGNSNVAPNPVSPLSNSNFILEAITDYKIVLDDDNKLIELANLLPTNEFPDTPDGLGAFSLVTGQPLRNTNQFLDDVPGFGTSRFFYKVRSVDASENHSLWSPCSVPVIQLDTTTPEPLIETSAYSINNKALLFWKKPDNNIREYIFIRTDIGIDNKVTIRKEISQLTEKPLFLINAQILILSTPLKIILPDDITTKEQVIQFLTDQFSLFEIRGLEKNVVPNRQYKLNISYDGSNTVGIKQIDFAVKRDAGIFYEIQFQNLIVNTEPAYLHFIDDTVTENAKYIYEIIPVKVIGPHTSQLKIKGAGIKTEEIEIKNFSEPQGFSITHSYVSLSNLPLPEFVPDSRTQISISKPTVKIFIRITRRIADETKKFIYTDFTNVSDNKIYKNWIELSSAEISFNFIDNEVNLTNNFEYLVEIKSELEIFANPIVLTI